MKKLVILPLNGRVLGSCTFVIVTDREELDEQIEGVFGEAGRGLAEAQGVEEEVDFTVGTFSKSLGAIGGYAAADHPRFDVLRFCARPYMFTASPSPASIASVRAALQRIEADPSLRTRMS